MNPGLHAAIAVALAVIISIGCAANMIRDKETCDAQGGEWSGR